MTKKQMNHKGTKDTKFLKQKEAEGAEKWLIIHSLCSLCFHLS